MPDRPFHLYGWRNYQWALPGHVTTPAGSALNTLAVGSLGQRRALATVTPSATAFSGGRATVVFGKSPLHYDRAAPPLAIVAGTPRSVWLTELEPSTVYYAAVYSEGVRLGAGSSWPNDIQQSPAVETTFTTTA